MPDAPVQGQWRGGLSSASLKRIRWERVLHRYPGCARMSLSGTLLRELKYGDPRYNLGVLQRSTKRATSSGGTCTSGEDSDEYKLIWGIRGCGQVVRRLGPPLMEVGGWLVPGE